MPYRVCGLECGQRGGRCAAPQYVAVFMAVSCLCPVGRRGRRDSRVGVYRVEDSYRPVLLYPRSPIAAAIPDGVTAPSGILDVRVHCVIEQVGSMWSHEPSNLAFGCGLVRALTLRASRWTVTLRSYTQMQCPCYTHLGVYSSDRTKRRPRRPRWRRRLCDCASLTWICECDVEQLYTDAALMLDASTRVVAAAGSGRASSTWHLHVSLASSTMQMAQQPS